MEISLYFYSTLGVNIHGKMGIFMCFSQCIFRAFLRNTHVKRMKMSMFPDEAPIKGTWKFPCILILCDTYARNANIMTSLSISLSRKNIHVDSEENYFFVFSNMELK